jgi:manganese/iron transport system ATP-binding protein/manganese/zinc/iron transport system ATP- binding protein
MTPPPNHALDIRDLTVSYARIPALHHIGFEVRCGQCVALLGPNGAGKTTLLKTLAGLVDREAGVIRFHGREVRGATPDIAYLPQRGQIDWDFPTTVRGLVEMGRYLRLGWWRSYSERDTRAVDAAISAMHLDALQDRQISALSGGQQQRAFLARALAQEAHVLLFDEPFTGLDKPNLDALKTTLQTLRQQGKLLLVSHHDLATVRELFDQVVLLNGELIAAGPTRENFTEENIRRAYATSVFAGLHHGVAV